MRTRINNNYRPRRLHEPASAGKRDHHARVGCSIAIYLAALMCLACITQTQAEGRNRDEVATATSGAHELSAHRMQGFGASAKPSVLPLETVQEPEATPEPWRRFALTDVERDIVERVVQAEAGGEDFDGKCLVAQCILNTSEATDTRPDAVVLAVINGCPQYATPAKEASEQVKEAVSAVFDDGYTVTSEPVRFFYAPARCYSRWHETSLVFVLEHGGHKFFKAP